MTTITTPGPTSDAEIPAYLRTLGIPGLADIHVHFLPEPMLRKVWAYFDQAGEHYGRSWPIHYRTDEQKRIHTLRGFGLRAIPALSYAHKPGMAKWLNTGTGSSPPGFLTPCNARRSTPRPASASRSDWKSSEVPDYSKSMFRSVVSRPPIPRSMRRGRSSRKPGSP